MQMVETHIPLHTNMLANVQSDSLMPALSWSQLWRRDSTRFIGIDIGASEVHVSSLGPPSPQQITDTRHSLRWCSRSRFDLPVNPFRPPSADLIDVICETLVDRLPRCVDGDRNIAAIALPTSWVHYETNLPAELEASRANCDTMFRESVFRSSAHVRHWPACDGSEQQVIAATAESAACRISQAIASIGYEVCSILPHGEALIHVAQETCSIDPCAVVALDWCGGIVATNNAGKCGLTRALPAFDVGNGIPTDVEQMESWLESIASEITATTRYVQRLSAQTPGKRPVLMCGNVAKVPGVDVALATMLGIPVASWRYSRRLRPVGAADPADDVTYHDPSRAVSVSLAYCAASRKWGER